MVFTEKHLVKPMAMHMMERGQRFSYNQLIRDVGSGETLSFLIRNTVSNVSDSSETSYIVITALEVSTEGKTIVENIRNVSIDSDGDVKDLHNDHTGYSNDTIAEIQEAPTFSGGDRLGKQLVGSNLGSAKVGGSDGSGFSAFILHPGGNVAGEITNEADGQGDLSISVEWYEVPKNLLQEVQPV